MPKLYDMVITNGKTIDGTGNPWFKGSVGVKGEKIVKIGKIDPSSGKIVLDASQKTVAPGFVDVHSHSDFTLIFDPRGREHNQTRHNNARSRPVWHEPCTDKPQVRESTETLCGSISARPKLKDLMDHFQTISNEDAKTSNHEQCSSSGRTRNCENSSNGIRRKRTKPERT